MCCLYQNTACGSIKSDRECESKDKPSTLPTASKALEKKGEQKDTEHNQIKWQTTTNFKQTKTPTLSFAKLTTFLDRLKRYANNLSLVSCHTTTSHSNVESGLCVYVCACWQLKCTQTLGVCATRKKGRERGRDDVCACIADVFRHKAQAKRIELLSRNTIIC